MPGVKKSIYVSNDDLHLLEDEFANYVKSEASEGRITRLGLSGFIVMKAVEKVERERGKRNAKG